MLMTIIKMIRKIQQVRSHEVELIELADFLIGAVAYAHRGLKLVLQS